MKVFFEDEEIKILIKNLNLFINDEQLLLNSFNSSFSRFDYFYRTNNGDELKAITDDLFDQIEKVHNNICTNELILNKTIDKYSDIILKNKLQTKKIDNV